MIEEIQKIKDTSQNLGEAYTRMSRLVKKKEYNSDEFSDAIKKVFTVGELMMIMTLDNGHYV